DAVLTPDEATLDLLRKMGRLATFGEGNPKTCFLFRYNYFYSVTCFGKASEHFKLSVATEFGDPLDSIAFFAKRELGKRVEQLEPAKRVTLLASLERDQFSKKRVPRLRIVSLG